MIYETERLKLKPVEISDASLILALLNSPKWLEFIGDRNVHTIEAAQDYIVNRMLPQFEKLGFGNYVIIEKQTGEKLGTCGLYDRQGLEGVDIGFALLPGNERNGYGFEAASKLMNLAEQEFNLHLIKGITIEKNIASQKLLEKLGLTYVGKTFLPDDDEELMLYEKRFGNNNDQSHIK